MPASERAFWEEVVARWIQSPGLLAVVVPYDLNQLEMGRWVRDQACQFRQLDGGGDGDHSVDPKDTYCYSLDSVSHASEVHNAPNLLPYVLGECDRLETARRSALGEIPFHLVVTGVDAMDETTVGDWLRHAMEGWPGVRPAAKDSQLHCCCLVTCPLPERYAPLPEGCDWLVAPDAEDEEIAAITSHAVTDYWRAEDDVTCRYVRSSLVDMASGRRTDAELAFAEAINSWERRDTPHADWYPLWPADCEAICRARDTLHREGIVSSWLQANETGYGAPASANIGRLWSQGLWRQGTGLNNIHQGLTSLARTALRLPQQVQPNMPPVPTPLSDAAVHVFRQSLHVEQSLKEWLCQQLQSTAGRGRIREILDAPFGEEPTRSLRDHVAHQVISWQTKVPADELRHDHTVISICSFGILKHIVLEFLPQRKADRIKLSLNVLVSARNAAAHGGWFTLNEYREVHEHISKIGLTMSGTWA